MKNQAKYPKKLSLQILHKVFSLVPYENSFTNITMPCENPVLINKKKKSSPYENMNQILRNYYKRNPYCKIKRKPMKHWSLLSYCMKMNPGYCEEKLNH